MSVAGSKPISAIEKFAVWIAIHFILVGFIAGIVSSCGPSTPSRSISDFLGEWTNKTSESYFAFTRLTIAASGDKAIIEFWTSGCEPGVVDCKMATLETAASDASSGVLRVDWVQFRVTHIEGTLTIVGRDRLEARLRSFTPGIGDRQTVESSNGNEFGAHYSPAVFRCPSFLGVQPPSPNFPSRQKASFRLLPIGPKRR